MRHNPALCGITGLFATPRDWKAEPASPSLSAMASEQSRTRFGGSRRPHSLERQTPIRRIVLVLDNLQPKKPRGVPRRAQACPGVPKWASVAPRTAAAARSARARRLRAGGPASGSLKLRLHDAQIHVYSVHFRAAFAGLGMPLRSSASPLPHAARLVKYKIHILSARLAINIRPQKRRRRDIPFEVRGFGPLLCGGGSSDPLHILTPVFALNF